MVIDFSKVNLRDRPVLVLRDIDGTAIQTLGYAFNIKTDGLCYNETSTISFDIPAYVDGKKTPHYDDIVGLRVIDVVGWGQFELVNPVVSKQGRKEIKSCKAYSLEYGFTKKKITLAEGTYNFWNPMAPEDTILGIILSYMPGWKVGSVDEALIGKYRTFSVSNENVYNFTKSNVQKTYGCVFDYDVYSRSVNVIATSTLVNTKPVYISCNNLAKQIEVEEDTENIITVLDVNGAEGVNIRSVNPTGTNKIYNLDYFIDYGLMPKVLAAKWKQWKTFYESYQTEYYYTSIDRMIRNSEILIEQEKLREMREVSLGSLESLRSAIIELLASLSDINSAEYIEAQDKLNGYNAQIADIENEIGIQEELISALQSTKDALTATMININKSVAFSNFFTADELIILDRFFIEDGIEDSTFVLSPVTAYDGSDLSYKTDLSNISVTGSVINKQSAAKNNYIMSGGSLNITGDTELNAEIINGTLEIKEDNNYVFTALLNSGKHGETSFPKGCLSMTGTADNLTDDTVSEDDVSSILTGTSLSFTGENVRVFFTANTTEYEQFSVEWDLFQYGVDCGKKLAYPSYKFKVSSANFLAQEDFRAFASQLTLGKKIYLEIDDGKVIEPILVKVSVDFDDLTSLELEFGDTYSLSDSSFSLVDLLEKSVSMGRTLDTSRFGYNSFIDSGASSVVKDFISAALDVSKNKIMSSKNMAVTWDENGIWCRKWNDSRTSYEPSQIAIINDNIVFTSDGWETAKMAIGHIVDPNLVSDNNLLGDAWGVVAPSIVGTLLAGQNLIIESVKKSGDVSVFRVDADGAVLHNASFDITNDRFHIALDPDLGFGIGPYPTILIDEDGNRTWDEDMANFWVDTAGNVHIRGTLEAADGVFTGVVKAADFQDLDGNSILTADRKFKSQCLDLGNIQLDGENGNITMTGDINLSGASSIIWSESNSPVKVLYSKTAIAAPDKVYSEYPVSDTEEYVGWHTVFDSLLDYYVAYSYDGGNTWTDAIKSQGSDGTDAEVTAENVFNLLTNNGELFGIFSGTDPDGNTGLYVNASYIKTGELNADLIKAGTIDASIISLQSKDGGFTAANGNDGEKNTTGAMMYGSNGPGIAPYIIVTDAGCRMTGSEVTEDSPDAPRVDITVMSSGITSVYENSIITIDTNGIIASAGGSSGNALFINNEGISSSVEIAVTSDRNLKNSIEYKMDRYEEFFMMLCPAFFKYNNETSDRIHTGFIAQDVLASLYASGLSFNDFAGIVADDDIYKLRYGEFVSLNTYMIQQLYHKVLELEDKLNGIGQTGD